MTPPSTSRQAPPVALPQLALPQLAQLSVCRPTMLALRWTATVADLNAVFVRLCCPYGAPYPTPDAATETLALCASAATALMEEEEDAHCR